MNSGENFVLGFEVQTAFYKPPVLTFLELEATYSLSKARSC